MKACGMILVVSFLIGLFSIKAAFAVLFLLTCTALCLWINRKARFESSRKNAESLNMVPVDFGCGDGDPDVVDSYENVVKGRGIY